MILAPGKEIHGRRANKAGDKEIGGMIVEFLRGTKLLDDARVEHSDAVAHRHSLDLVMGDVDDRRLDPTVQLDDLGTRGNPQLRIEIRERFVHQEDIRLAHNRSTKGHPLALSP